MTKLGYMLDQEDAWPDNTTPGPHKLVYIEDGDKHTLARFQLEPGTQKSLLFMCYIANEGLKGRGFELTPEVMQRSS